MTIFDYLHYSEEEVINFCKESITLKKPGLITYFNQHSFNLYCNDYEYKKLLKRKYFYTYPDGIGIYLVLKIFYKREIRKFNATDLNEKLLEYFANNKTRIFIIGGNFNEKILSTITEKNNLNVVGYLNGFFPNDGSKEIINLIYNKKPGVVIIGMGVPKQEKFAYELSKKLDTQLIICVGNFLEFYFTTIKRVPKLYRNSGFEWLYRLIVEPTRLWKRYLLGIPLFIIRIVKYEVLKKYD